jgi:hypothetical protein
VLAWQDGRIYATALPDRLLRLPGDFNVETDRGAALAATAMIDDLLGKALKAFMMENAGADAILNGLNAPLGFVALLYH